MCLTTTKFSLKTSHYTTRPFEHEVPCGIGYKLITNEAITDKDVEPPILNEWMKAKFARPNGYGKPEIISAMDLQTYWPGFHIWLKPEHAEKYFTLYSREQQAKGATVYEVKYRNIISFGKNECGFTDSTESNVSYEDCVIAYEMCFISKVKEFPVKEPNV